MNDKQYRQARAEVEAHNAATERDEVWTGTAAEYREFLNRAIDVSREAFRRDYTEA